jgi:Ca2+/Na+ antiporter
VADHVETTARARAWPTAVVVGVAALLAVWLAAMTVVVPVEVDRFFGISLALLGLFIVALHRRMGTQAFSEGRRMSRLWDRIGEHASRRLYFAIGALLVLFGAVFLILSVIHENRAV